MLPPFEDSDTGDRKPPAEVRILDLHAEPWPDGRRVRVHLELTPFQEKPNLSLVITTRVGDISASAAVIESFTHKLVITLHLRAVDPTGSYRLEASVSYPEIDLVDRLAVDFTVLPGESEPG
jgi:hypothetical protein